MKKIFTLFAVAAMAFTASAQEVETWAAGGDVADNVVTLPSITATFLDNTSKGSTAGAGSWTFNASDVRGDQNGLEIKFEPTKNGELEIVFAANVASNKSINMFVNGDTGSKMDARLSDGTVIKSGVNLEDQEPAIDGIEKGNSVFYDLKKGNTYNYYTGGTKWRLASFNFKISADQSGIADIVTDENAPVEYFNLQGVRVENPANGLYIKRQGSQVSKVIVK